MITFNKPAVTGCEQNYLNQVFERGKFSGGGPFSVKCGQWLQAHFSMPGVFLTTSCTHSLEMAAIMCDLNTEDEIILPSYAFSSTATAFVRCGAKLVFVDIEPTTMNIDPEMVEAAVTPNTKVIVVLHYGGVACDMESISKIAKRHGLQIVEDAAQAMFSTYRGRHCGTLGTFGCISYHESKNLHCGEGGALICNDSDYGVRAEIILEKGTDRSRFFRGEVDKYTWIDVGSSYVLSELNAAFLLSQLEQGKQITTDRLNIWNDYYKCFQPLVEDGIIEVPRIPGDCQHNGHIFWIKTKDLNERTRLMGFLAEKGIHSVFHYQPLHSSPAGQKFGRFSGEDCFTTRESERLLRLPLFYGFDKVGFVSSAVKDFYHAKL